MLFTSTGEAARDLVVADTHDVDQVQRAVWIDLLNPSDSERSLVERGTLLRVPALEELAEIESSSRLNVEHGALYLSTPMGYLDADGMARTKPLGFVLSEKVLLTVRFAETKVFDQYAARLAAHDSRPCSCEAFLGLLDAMVDRYADILEQIRGELDTISQRVFRPEQARANSAKTDLQLRATLRSIGRAGDRLSNLRDSLLGVQRIVQYTATNTTMFMPEAMKPRLNTLRRDITSLTDYDVQLSNKVQFLLDATLGFINIEQNNSIKILTVVSVVGVPPTLVASIYGMNFKWIPELEWHYGYFYGLGVIALTAIIPYLWFKRKGWI